MWLNGKYWEGKCKMIDLPRLIVSLWIYNLNDLTLYIELYCKNTGLVYKNWDYSKLDT